MLIRLHRGTGGIHQRTQTLWYRQFGKLSLKSWSSNSDLYVFKDDWEVKLEKETKQKTTPSIKKNKKHSAFLPPLDRRRKFSRTDKSSLSATCSFCRPAMRVNEWEDTPVRWADGCHCQNSTVSGSGSAEQLLWCPGCKDSWVHFFTALAEHGMLGRPQHGGGFSRLIGRSRPVGRKKTCEIIFLLFFSFYCSCYFIKRLCTAASLTGWDVKHWLRSGNSALQVNLLVHSGGGAREWSRVIAEMALPSTTHTALPLQAPGLKAFMKKQNVEMNSTFPQTHLNLSLN